MADDHNEQANLLGPPELRRMMTSEEDNAEANTGDAFMDSMLRNFNRDDLPGRLPRGFTANNSPTYLSSGHPCLDLFFHAVPGTPARSLNRMLRLSWAHDPLTTLKLVSNLRAVRGTGKSDRDSFFTTALWLHRHHPRTLSSNLASFAELGCFKDLPEILYRLLEGPQVRRKQRAEWLSRKYCNREDRSRRRRRRQKTSVPREIRVARAEEWSRAEKERARELRLKKRLDMAKKVAERYTRNWDFKLLYDKVSDHFAERLKNDLENLNSGETAKISLAAKWCPSLDSSFDRSTLLCESIAKRVFPREQHPEYEGIEEAHYAYRVRDRLRKEVLVPLRKALQLTEVYTGAGRWDKIPYERVPSVAMKLYKDKFLKHDGQRFINHLQQKDSKVSSGALIPKLIVESLHNRSGRGQVAEIQWERSVSEMPRNNKLKNCLAICDVSGSNKAAEASMTLGLFVSEMCEEPWKGKLITFGGDPKLHVVEGCDLRTKLESLKKKNNTESADQKTKRKKKDIQKVFDLILQVAVEGELSEEEMIKRVFVFSDMEFDRASCDDSDTNYDVITRRFSERGYGLALPEIVFWKLRGSESTPVPANQRRVAMVSGFSKNLLRLFRGDEQIIDPVTVMESAISGDEYQRLIVAD